MLFRSVGGAKAAREVYTEAARAGHPGAQNNLGAMLIDGRGGERDEPGAARWYAQAAAGGNLEAQYNLALLHGRGRGVARNDAEMARLLASTPGAVGITDLGVIRTSRLPVKALAVNGVAPRCSA